MTTGRHRTPSQVTGSFRKKRNRKLTETDGLRVVSLKTILSVLLSIAAVGGAWIGITSGWEVLVGARRLQVQVLEVRGAKRVSRAEIDAYTNIEVGSSILAVELDSVALRLRRHPWVKRARVLRRMPDRIIVEIEEHDPQIIVAVGDAYLANSDGQLFKRLSPTDDTILPVLSGIDAEGITDDREQIDHRIQFAVELTSRVQRERIGALEQLSWSDSSGWSVIVRPASAAAEQTMPVAIHLGFDPLKRVTLAGSAVKLLATLARSAREVWVDGPESRVFVRLFKKVAESSEQTFIAKAGG